MRRRLITAILAVLVTVGVAAPASASPQAAQSVLERVIWFWQELAAVLFSSADAGQEPAPEEPQQAESSGEGDEGPTLDPAG